MRTAIRYLLLFLLWNLLTSLVLLLGLILGYPVSGLLLTLALYAALIWRVILHPRTPADRWALLRLRPLNREQLKWTFAAIPVLLLFSWALGEVYVRLVPVPPDSFDPFGALMSNPWGRLGITVLAVGIAPVVEEFFFRGFIQRSLERRFGAAPGIILASAIFAAVHVLPWIFPLHFFLGLAFGYAVWITRSIWTGVILHAANNSVAIMGLGVEGDEPMPTPTLWQVGPDVSWWSSVALLVVSGMLAWRVAERLRKAARVQNLHQPAIDG